jgi:hypothetical protein
MAAEEGNILLKITEDPLRLQDATSFISHNSTGAISVFVGL